MNIKVKEGGSIWQLATLWGKCSLPKDFCSLFWTILTNFTLVTTAALGVGVILAQITLVCLGVYDLHTIISALGWFCLTWGIIMLTLGLLASFTDIIIHCFSSWDNKDIEPSTLGKIYVGIKGKYCPLVDIKKLIK